MTRRAILWRWQVLVIVLAEVTLVLALIEDTSVLRRTVVVVFLTLCPGLSFVRLIGLKFDGLADVTYAATASLVIVGIVAGSTLFAGVWSPEDSANAIAAALIVIVAASAVARSRRSQRRRERKHP